MKCICADFVEYLATGGTKYRAVIVAAETPASLAITGADVDDLQDDDVLAAGSVLITPNANYIAFADGTFTEKE